MAASMPKPCLARLISTAASLNARLMTAPGPEHILALYGAHGHNFDAVNLSTAWSRLSRATAAWPARRQAAFFSEHEPMLHNLQTSMGARLSEFGARELANTAYASACFSYEPALGLMSRVREHAPAHSAEYKPQELANMAWGFAKAGLRSPSLFAMVEREALPKLATFKPIELASLAWAFAKDGIGSKPASDRLFAGIAREAEARIGDFNARALFNLAWAFAATRRPDDRLFDAIARAAIPVCASFSPHQIAILAWAMGKARARQPLLVRALAEAAIPNASRLQPKHVVMLLWSAVRCGAADERLLGALSREVERTAPSYSPLELSLVLWASAAAHSQQAGTLFALAAAQLAPEVRTCDGRALSLLTYACAVSGHAAHAAPLLDALCSDWAERGPAQRGAFEVLDRAGREEPQGERQGKAPSGAPADRHAARAARAHPIELPDLVRTGWALTVARRHSPALVRELTERVNALEPAALAAQSAQLRVQLHQINLSLRLLAPPSPAGAPAPPRLAAEHAAVCAGALRHDAEPCVPSALHLSVSAALRALGIAHANEFVVPGLECTVDIAARVPSGASALRLAADAPPLLTATVAIAAAAEEAQGDDAGADRGDGARAEHADARPLLIEVNGPHHYLPSGALRPTSELKHAHLRSAGWRLLTVRHDEWLALAAEPARLRFLREAILSAEVGSGARGCDVGVARARDRLAHVEGAATRTATVAVMTHNVRIDSECQQCVAAVGSADS